MKTKEQLEQDYQALLAELGSWMVNAVLMNKVLHKKYQKALYLTQELSALEEMPEPIPIPESAAEANLEPPTLDFYGKRFSEIK